MDSYHRLVNYQRNHEPIPDRTSFRPRATTAALIAAMIAWVLFLVLR
jgi:hypothetical protein